jgi:hypothetical protein
VNLVFVSFGGAHGGLLLASPRQLMKTIIFGDVCNLR